MVVALQMYLTQGDRVNTSVSNVRLRSLQSVHSALFVLKMLSLRIVLGHSERYKPLVAWTCHLIISLEVMMMWQTA